MQNKNIFHFRKSYWVLLTFYLTTVASILFYFIQQVFVTERVLGLLNTHSERSTSSVANSAHKARAGGRMFRMWVQGGTSHSRHIEAIPDCRQLGGRREREPTQSVLSLLLLSMSPQPVLSKKKIKKWKYNKKNKKKSTETAAASNFRSSGTCGAWTWTRMLHLSTPCRKGPWRSRSVGRFPGRASLSSSAECTPPPASAPACRSWSRSDGRSSSLLSSRTSADKGRPRALSREVEEMR